MNKRAPSGSQCLWSKQLLRLSLLAFGCLLVACPTEKLSSASSKHLQFEACKLRSQSSSARIDASCTQLQVPEDWSHPEAKQLHLSLATIPASAPKSATTPLFFLAGGPGQAASEAFVDLASAFAPINKQHDIILLNQRGTQGSHPLSCRRDEQQDPYEDLDDEQMVQWLIQCVTSLDADTRQYTTLAAVRDLEQARQLLGYDRIDIYGVSYGTRVALSYLKQYPNRVRSLVLDGVVAQDTVLGDAVGRNVRRSLDLLLQSCTQNTACAAAFPDLNSTFLALQQRILEAQPTVHVDHPRTGQPVDVKMTPALFGAYLRFLSYSTETSSQIPLLIYQAQHSGDLSKIAAQALYVTAGLEQSITSGLDFSVRCAEDFPFYPDDTKELDPFFGDHRKALLAKICTLWPHQTVSAEFKQPVHSDVPVLLLSGEFDPATPPADAERVLKSLVNGRHIIVNGQGHGVIMRGCIPKLAAEFLRTADAVNLDVSCVAKIEAAPFFIDPSGPEP